MKKELEISVGFEKLGSLYFARQNGRLNSPKAAHKHPALTSYLVPHVFGMSRVIDALISSTSIVFVSADYGKL
jgi:hypothetical protein